MAISKISAQAEGRIASEAEEQERRDKARHIALGIVPAGLQTELVNVRVLPLGDGKISMGQHVGGVGEVYYARGEVISDVELPIAEALEARGFGEIQAPQVKK